MQDEDEVLYRRFLGGDKDALDGLLERYGGSLTLFLRGYVDCMEDAEDLMMDTFVVIATKKSWKSKGSSFKTWLFAIGRKLALLHWRKRKRYRFVPGVPDMQGADFEGDRSGLTDPDEHPEQRLLREERNAQLYAALEKLPAQYREILFLLYFEEMDYEEAGVIMKKNRKQLYHLAERGRASLKSELERMGFDDGR